MCIETEWGGERRWEKVWDIRYIKLQQIEKSFLVKKSRSKHKNVSHQEDLSQIVVEETFLKRLVSSALTGIGGWHEEKGKL